MRFWKLLKAYGEQVFIALDQLANALIPPLEGTVSYADGIYTRHLYRTNVKNSEARKDCESMRASNPTMKGHRHG